MTDVTKTNNDILSNQISDLTLHLSVVTCRTLMPMMSTYTQHIKTTR